MTIEFVHSFYLAKVLGLFLVIVSIIMLGKAPYYRAMISNIEERGASFFNTALIWLFIGLNIVLLHQEWALEPRILVTIFGWIVLLKSIFWMGFPECMFKMTKSIYSGKGYYVVLVIALVYGVLLMSKGFHPYKADVEFIKGIIG